MNLHSIKYFSYRLTLFNQIYELKIINIFILVDGLKKGSYWAKRSSLLRLGFYDSGNMAEGIIPVNFKNE
jgi:hypothetical protein